MGGTCSFFACWYWSRVEALASQSKFELELALTHVALRTLGRLAVLAARVVCIGKETPAILVLCTVYQAGEAKK